MVSGGEGFVGHEAGGVSVVGEVVCFGVLHGGMDTDFWFRCRSMRLPLALCVRKNMER